MNCKIVGYEYKTLEVTLSPGESFYAERGSIVYVDAQIQRNVEMNNSSSNRGVGGLLAGAVKSALSGESILIIRLSNPTNHDLKMVLSGSLCSLVPIKIQGESSVCRRGHYVASTAKVDVGLRLSAQGFLGGMGALFQKVEGHATVFLDSLGTPIEKQLEPNETIEVDENHLVAMHGISPIQVQAGWSIGNVLRGEGVSMMRISGPGKVYLSPLSMFVSTK